MHVPQNLTDDLPDVSRHEAFNVERLEVILSRAQPSLAASFDTITFNCGNSIDQEYLRGNLLWHIAMVVIAK